MALFFLLKLVNIQLDEDNTFNYYINKFIPCQSTGEMLLQAFSRRQPG